jgi:hypothetical protein
VHSWERKEPTVLCLYICVRGRIPVTFVIISRRKNKMETITDLVERKQEPINYSPWFLYNLSVPFWS